MTSVAILSGKITGAISKNLRLGAGVTWAGEIGLWFDKNLISKLIPKNAKVILIAGTNGKTTTAKLLQSILKKAENKVVLNQSGANLLNGIAGTLLQAQPAEFYIFEVDENNLIPLLKQIKASVVILLNLFRDQLDRYGEVDKIAKDWEKSGDLRGVENLILNADDPQLAWLGAKLKKKVSYFGLGDSKLFLGKMQHATDSIFCPNCGARLEFSGFYLSHLGEYQCPKCGFRHPKNDLNRGRIEGFGGLEGIYNYYNLMAATLAAKELGIKDIDFSGFKPAFGRSEEIGKAKILLSKNPAGFNESLRTVVNSDRKGPVLLVLNDRVPDGRDVSWVWDVDFEELQKWNYPIMVSGDRKWDLALRLKYGGIKGFRVCDLEDGAKKAAWILPTYSAMLEARKILTGRKIL